MFSEIIWGTEEPTGKTVTWDREEYSNDYNLSLMMERVAYFYLRQVDAAIFLKQIVRV